MQEYIAIPKYFHRLSIDCKILEDFLEDADYIEDKKINVDSLRKFYVENREEGIILIDELKLRGFEFVLENPSALLSTIRYQGDIELIYTGKDEGKISKINKNIFNYFDYRDLIKSDFYFNLIPIHGFENITKDFNYDLIKHEFLRYGYEILKEEEIEAIYGRKTKEPTDDLRYNNHLDFNKFLEEVLEKYQAYKDEIKNLRLITILPKNSSNEINIRTKLRRERIRTIEELMNHSVDDLLDIKGINPRAIYEFKINILKAIKGLYKDINIIIEQENHKVKPQAPRPSESRDPKKIESSKEQAEELESHEYNSELNKFLKDIVREDPLIYDQMKKIDLRAILPNRMSAENSIKRKLIKDNIKTLDKLIDYDISRLESLRGVGVKRIDEFKETIVEAIKNIDGEIDLSIENIGQADISLYLKRSVNKNGNIERMFKSKQLQNLIPADTNTDKDLKHFLYKENILTIYDLIDYDISSLRQVANVGIKKVNDIKAIIAKEIKSIESSYEMLENGRFHLEEPLFSLVKDYRISDIISILYDNEFYFSEEIINRSISYFQNLEYKNIEELDFISFLNKLSLDLKETYNLNHIIDKAKQNNLSQRDKSILYKRVILARTLEEVGQEFDLTRERIRQIEKKIIKKYNLSLKKNNFLKSLRLNFNNKDYFYLNDLRDLLEEENFFILGMITNAYIDNLYYYKLLERVYLKEHLDMVDKVEEITSQMPSYGDVEEELAEIIKSLSNILIDLNYEEGLKLLEEKGVTVMGTYFFKGKKSNQKMLEIIYKYVHKTPLTLNEKGANLLKKYFLDIFDYKIENSVRNWDATTSRIPDIMLVGPKTYLHLDHINISSKIIKQIKILTDKALLDQSYVYAEKIFDKLNTEFPNNNIISKHHVYSMIKYYYSEFYETSTGNSLRIGKKGAPDITNAEYLYAMLLKNNGVLDFETIKQTTKWENYRIDMVISTSEKLIKVGSQKVAILDSLFKEDEKARFIEILEDDMKLGYTTTNRVYLRFRFDETMNSFLKRNNINNAIDIAHIMKALDENIRGHNVFMYYENQDIKNVRDVISSRYPVKVYRYQIIEILNEFNMSEDQIAYHLKAFLLEKHYVQISREEYLNYKYFSLDKEIEDSIISFFDKIYKEKGFIVTEEYVSEITRNYKSNEYGWNQFTLATILIKNGYKRLERFNSDYRYERLVLVKEDREFDDIAYLIYDLIKNQYQGNLHEIPVYEFLSEKGIYRLELEDYNKKLQIDAKSEDLISVDMIGNIKLKE